MTTLKNIADLAGVSARTVQRALRANGYVRRDVRENILDIARNLDYSPNRFARGLKLGRSLDVALCALTPACLHELHVAKLSAMERELSARGFALNIHFACEAGEERALTLQDVMRRNPAAMALLSSRTYGTAGELSCLLNAKMPVLLLDCFFPGLETICVDRAQGVCDAVLFLAKKGRKRIAYLGPKTAGSAARLKGYRRAMKRLGRPPMHIECPYIEDQTFFTGQKAGLEFSRLPKPPDAVQVFADEMALGFIAGLRESGIGIPDDIAVMGFDNRRMSALATPALSTVAQPNTELGIAAAGILLARMNNGTGPAARLHKIPMKIIERETT